MPRIGLSLLICMYMYDKKGWGAMKFRTENIRDKMPQDAKN